ncbi:hypothetical protein B0H11DRAFT_1942742 [Mycena galericulata]|nr:hypothetical protein B0H11DRAFT_1942742 [Mycena galericulata]
MDNTVANFARRNCEHAQFTRVDADASTVDSFFTRFWKDPQRDDLTVEETIRYLETEVLRSESERRRVDEEDSGSAGVGTSISPSPVPETATPGELRLVEMDFVGPSLHPYPCPQPTSAPPLAPPPASAPASAHARCRPGTPRCRAPRRAQFKVSVQESNSEQVQVLMALCDGAALRVKCIRALECLAQRAVSIDASTRIAAYLVFMLPTGDAASPAGTELMLQAAALISVASIDIYPDEDAPWDVNFRPGVFLERLAGSVSGEGYLAGRRKWEGAAAAAGGGAG